MSVARWRRAAGGALGLCAAGGLLAGFSQVHPAWYWLGFVAFVPFLWVLERARSWREALVLGWVMSAVLVAATLDWFPSALHRYTGLGLGWGWALLLLTAPLLQAQLGIAALLRFGMLRLGAPGWAASLWIAAYVGVEWAWPKLLEDTVGYGLVASSSWRQLAELGGVAALTAVLLLGNEVVLVALRWRHLTAGRRRAQAGRALTALGVLGATFTFGAVRWRQLEPAEGPPLRVAGIQANLTDYAGLAESLGTYDAAVKILGTHLRLSAAALAHGQDLVVWPETVYPTTFGAPQSPEGAELDAELAAFATATGTPMLIGAYDRDGGGEYNAAFLLAPGALPEASPRYRKARLFPLTEYVPGWLDGPLLRRLLPWAGTWRPGAGASTLTLPSAGGAIRVAPLICFDSLDPTVASAAVRDGAQLLIAISNDAWFRGTRAPHLHLMAAALRSVETRRWQVRVTTTGLSALIDARGEVVEVAPAGTEAVLRATARLRGGAPTLQVRLGDWVGPACFAVALALAAWAGWRARRRTR